LVAAPANAPYSNGGGGMLIEQLNDEIIRVRALNLLLSLINLDSVDIYMLTQ
jgi:hypothetical protein